MSIIKLFDDLNTDKLFNYFDIYLWNLHKITHYFMLKNLCQKFVILSPQRKKVNMR